MKKQNLTREEALKAAIDGRLVSHDRFPDARIGMEWSDHGRAEFYFEYPWCTREPLDAAMSQEFGYYIIEPEPKFKEVVMYAPVMQSTESDMPRIPAVLEVKRDDAMKRVGAIGYIEVKVFLKEDQ